MSRSKHAGFLTGWLTDQHGNVAMITAISILPLLGIVGGGIDMSRAYMARTQLQAACDAGVLAGRRSMSGSGEYGPADKAKAQKMFDANFAANSVQADDVGFTTAANDEGQVTGEASAQVPTVIMSIFGKDEFNLETDCMAELQIANADVMFVLDTTGSMGGSRIAGLRDAVRDFHTTLAEAIKDESTRVRYGFVPYSMTVNATDLFADPETPMPRSYFRDSAPYETREAQFNTPIHVGTTEDLGTTYETYQRDIRRRQCQDYGDNDYPGNGSNPETTGSPPGKVRVFTYSFHSWVGSGSRRTCTRAVHTTETTYVTKFAFTNWRYKESELDTSVFKSGGSAPFGTVVFPTDGSGNVDYASYDTTVHTYADQAGYYDMVSLAKKNGNILHNVLLTGSTWNGCIEERDTVAANNFNQVPNGAYDLDLDLAPSSEETRWRPLWPAASFLRDHHQHEDAILDAVSNHGHTNYVDRDNAHSVCPSSMKLFTEVDMTGDPSTVPGWLDSYLNGLIATGNTYHDIGMIWGGRLSSPRGIFAENVNKDDKAVSRHLIFMTDGQMQPYIWGNNAYGIETLSNRIAPPNSDTAEVSSRHSDRFLSVCTAIKNQGITLWVVAFGTSLTNNLVTCSSDGRAYHSSDAEALRERFRFIASQVANLRLGD